MQAMHDGATLEKGEGGRVPSRTSGGVSTLRLRLRLRVRFLDPPGGVTEPDVFGSGAGAAPEVV